MSIGNVLKETRRGMSQQKLSHDLNVSREAVSAYETGRAALPRDVSSRLVKILDDPRLAFEIAEEYTGGSWIPWLDSEAMELNRFTLKDMSIRELQEAVDQIAGTCLARKPDHLDPMSREEIRKLISESMDAVGIVTNLIATVCKEYRFSWSECWENNREEWERQGLLKQKKRPEGR